MSYSFSYITANIERWKNTCRKLVQFVRRQRHRKQHEKKLKYIDETNMGGHTTGEMKHVDEAHRREKSLDQFKTDHFAEFKDFEKQIELGRNINILINEEGFNINGLSTDMKQALKAYENYAENIVEIDWRGWQKD